MEVSWMKVDRIRQQVPSEKHSCTLSRLSSLPTTEMMSVDATQQSRTRISQ